MNPQKSSKKIAVRKMTPWLLITQSFCQGWVRTNCWGIALSSKMSICRRGADKLPAAPSWQIKGEMGCNFLLKRTEDSKVKSCLCKEATGTSDVDKAIYVLACIVLNMCHLKKKKKKKAVHQDTWNKNWEPQVKHGGKKITHYAQCHYLLTKVILVVRRQKKKWQLSPYHRFINYLADFVHLQLLDK